MNKEESIITIKIVKSKSGKPLYYESTGGLSKEYWTRVGKDYYEYYVKEYQDYAIEIKRDENGGVNFMRFKLDLERSWAKHGIKPTREEYRDENGTLVVKLGFEKIQDKKPKGCAPVVAALIIIAIAVYLL